MKLSFNIYSFTSCGSVCLRRMSFFERSRGKAFLLPLPSFQSRFLTKVGLGYRCSPVHLSWGSQGPNNRTCYSHSIGYVSYPQTFVWEDPASCDPVKGNACSKANALESDASTSFKVIACFINEMSSGIVSCPHRRRTFSVFEPIVLKNNEICEKADSLK